MAKKKTANKKTENWNRYQAEYQRGKTRELRNVRGMIDELLAKVDKKKRSAIERNPERFLRTYWPDDYCFPFTADQKKRIKIILSIIKKRGVQSLAEPRGDGKTIICEGLIVYAIVKGLIRFTVVVKANTEQAKEFIDNILTKITDDNFAEAYPEVAYPFIEIGNVKQKIAGQNYDGQATNIGISKTEIIFPEIPGVKSAGCRMRGYGMDKPIRGVRVGDQRPDFFIVDDPETEESAVSKVEILKRSKRLDKEVSKLGGPARKISGIMLTTILAKDSLSDIYTDRKKKPAWGGVRNKALTEWPKERDMWEKYIHLRQQGQLEGDRAGTEANKYYKANRKKMDAGVKLSNPNVYDRSSELSAIHGIYNFIADYGIEAFQTEYQNDPPEEKVEEGLEIVAATVQKRCEGTKQGIIPDGYTHLTAGIDIGGRICYWQVTAWKDDFIGHIVDYGVFPVHGPGGNLQAEENQAELEEAIRLALVVWHDEHHSGYCYRSGEVKPLDCVAIDAGYQTQAIYNFIKDMGSKAYIPIMGYGTNSRVGKYRKPRGDNKHCFVYTGWHKTFHEYQNMLLWLHHCDDDYFKFKVQQGFILKPDTPGGLTIYGEEPYEHKTFARSIVSEKRVEEFKAGRGLVVEYVIKDKNQNHYLDATKYSRVAAAVAGVSRPAVIQAKAKPRETLRRQSKPKVRIRTKY